MRWPSIHLTDVPFGHGFRKPDDLSPREEQFFGANTAWVQQEGAYALIHSTKPEGHIAALEEPALLAEDLREWFRGSRGPRS